ncbi:uncharacterized protein G2W53_010425 [Senna tora]|uniref:Uncharacterized protein n=1 Tax=Senna tora TaxID=362788 RepID=A0A834WZX1_9FABA|nr:uncharacterized protein G2W53_010425 [Senna tora]
MTESLAIEAAVECVENLGIDVAIIVSDCQDVSCGWVCTPPSSLARILASDKLGDRAGIG